MKVTMDNCTGIILCGGKSSRMGFDKSLLKVDGTWLLLKTARTLSEIFTQVIFVSNSKEKLFGKKEFSESCIIEDHYRDLGPLGGICTAFEETVSPYLFVMAGDMPYPDIEVIKKMYQVMGKAQVVLCSRNQKEEPLFAFYHRSCYPVFLRQLQQNELRIRKEFNQLQVVLLELNEEEGTQAFFNLNTPQDLGCLIKDNKEF